MILGSGPLTLRIADFWSLPDYRLTGNMTERVEQSFYNQCLPEERPAFLFESGDAPLKNTTTNTNGKVSRQSTQSPDTEEKTVHDEQGTDKPGSDSKASPERSNAKAGKKHKDPSLLRALHKVFWLQFWTAGVLKLFSGTSRPRIHRAHSAEGETLGRYPQHDYTSCESSPSFLVDPLVCVLPCQRGAARGIRALEAAGYRVRHRSCICCLRHAR